MALARKLIRNEYFLLGAMVVIFIVADCLIVFNSPYDTFLDSDMGGYYNKPFRIYEGDEKAVDHWVGFAPYYPRILSVELSWLHYFHLNQYFLEFVLLQNIVLSAIAIVALYFIGLSVTRNKIAALALAAVYGLSYPRLYYNAFVLTEPFIVPLIIISLWMLHAWRGRYSIAICGLVLATAVGVRPSNGLLGLSYGLYILFAGVSVKKMPLRDFIKLMWPRVLRAAAFSIAFFLIIINIAAENYRISDGKVRGLTSHSGYNFLLGQAQAHRIDSYFDGLLYVFVPPSVAHHPENGTIVTDIPIYDSARFYEEGWKILKAYPRLWLEHFAMYPSLFFDNLFPATDAVPGFATFFDPYRYIVFYMFVFLGLLYISLREKDVSKADVLLYGSIFFLCAGSLYLFTVTHTYFFDFSYTVYVLFAAGAYSAIKHFSKHRKFILSYGAVVLVLTGVFWTYKALAKVFIDKNIRVTITQNADPVTSLYQPRNPSGSEVLDVDVLEFYLHWPLQHRTLGNLEYYEQFFIDADTEMEVLKEGNYRFSFYTDDGFEVFLDGQRIMGRENVAESMEILPEIFISQGTHKLEVKMFQGYGDSALMGYYRRLDGPQKPPDIIVEPKGGRGLPIGQEDEFTRFHDPSW
ncbi:MAG TPA: hypothetical protein VFX02_05835 [Gammaproteobacteria bacterium]|nr:hypothetical protein [Gammaproteobacteria bacterium]